MKGEAVGKNADDCVWFIANLELLADGMSIACEMFTPERSGENNDVCGRRFAVASEQTATIRRMYSEHVKHAGGRSHNQSSLSAIASTRYIQIRDITRHRLELPRLSPNVAVVGP